METKTPNSEKRRLTKRIAFLITGGIVLLIIVAILTIGLLTKKQQEDGAQRSIAQVSTRTKALIGTLNQSLNVKSSTPQTRDNALGAFAIELSSIQKSVCEEYSSQWYTGIVRIFDGGAQEEQCKQKRESISKISDRLEDLKQSYAEDAVLANALLPIQKPGEKTINDQIALWDSVKKKVNDLKDSTVKVATLERVSTYSTALQEIKKASDEKNRTAYEAAEAKLKPALDDLKNVVDVQKTELETKRTAFNDALKTVVTN